MIIPNIEAYRIQKEVAEKSYIRKHCFNVNIFVCINKNSSCYHYTIIWKIESFNSKGVMGTCNLTGHFLHFFQIGKFVKANSFIKIIREYKNCQADSN